MDPKRVSTKPDLNQKKTEETMVKKASLTRMLICLVALTLVGVAALALGSSHNGIVTTSDGKYVIATKGPSTFTLAEGDSDAALTTIAGNLSKYPFGVYFCCYGNTIAGPNAGFGHTYWAAMGFTPTANATVTKLKASVGFVVGVNQVVLGLYSDSNGVPGSPLLNKRTKLNSLGNFGSCCLLGVVNDAAGIPVTAGTPYWVVVSTDAKSATTFAAWAFNSTDMRQTVNRVAGYVDGTWNSGTGLQAGFAVLGH
jgi:hypothetical protein